MKKLFALLLLLALTMPFFPAPTASAQAYTGPHRLSSGAGQLNPDGTFNATKNGADDAPNNRGFNSPFDTAIDTTNNRLFASDFNNNRVLVYNLNGDETLGDRTPDFVLGQPDFVTTTATVTQAKLNGPTGMCILSSNLFIVDTNANRVMVFDISSITNGENAVNVIGQANFTSSASATTQAGLNTPSDCVAWNANPLRVNRLAISDRSNNRVMVYDIQDGITNGENALFVLGQANFTSGAAATTQTGMSSPRGLALDRPGVTNRLYVADSSNHRVLVFNEPDNVGSNGQTAANVLGQVNFVSATTGLTDLKFNEPHGVISATTSTFFVTDSNNSRVLKFDVTAIADGEAATAAIGQANFTSNVMATTSTGLKRAIEFGTFDATNSVLYVADSGNHRIVSYSNANQVTGGAAVNGLGQNDTSNAMIFTKGSANDALSATGFTNPSHVALDTVGHRLFVSDETNNRVLSFNLDSSNNLVDRTADNVLGVSGFFGPTSGGNDCTLMNLPTGLAYDETRSRLFVANIDRVQVFNLADGLTNGETAQYVLGYPNCATPAGGTTQSTFGGPNGLAFDSGNNRLYVADEASNRIMIFDLANIANGMNASDVLGQNGLGVFNSSTTGISQTAMNQPSGVAIDTTNHILYVADRVNNRVLAFNLDTNNSLTDRTADSVLGQSTFTANAAATTQAGLSGPRSLAIDSSRQLFVTDGGNNRVMVYDVASITDGENAVSVFCQDTYTTNTGAAANNRCDFPKGVFVNPSLNHLYVAEYSNHRVSQQKLIRITTTALSSTTATYNTSFSTTALSSENGDYTSAPTYSVATGSTLPSGLTLNATDGSISGTPTVTGTFTFSIRLMASFTNTGSIFDDQSYSLTIKPAAASSSTISNPGGSNNVTICVTDPPNPSGTTYTVTNTTTIRTVAYDMSAGCVTETGLSGGTYNYTIVGLSNGISSDTITVATNVVGSSSASSAPAPAAAAPLPQYSPPPPTVTVERTPAREEVKVSEPAPTVEIKPEEVAPLTAIESVKPPEVVAIPMAKPAEVITRPREIRREPARITVESRVTEPKTIPSTESIEEKNQTLLSREVKPEERVTAVTLVQTLDRADLSPEVQILKKACERSGSTCLNLSPEKTYERSRLEQIGIDGKTDEPLTRAEALAFVLAEANLAPALAPDELSVLLGDSAPLPLISDATAESEKDIWIPVAINTACELNVIDCAPGLLFSPDAPASKADVQAFIAGAGAALKEAGMSPLTAQKDSDLDGLTDAEEKLVYKTDPKNADSDGDGLTDGSELKLHKTNPFNADSDGDGLGDFNEVRKIGSNPLKNDTDDDCFSDTAEVASGTNPKNKSSVPTDKNKNCIPDSTEKNVKTEIKSGSQDTDNDGIYDKKELELGLNPESADTDRDGISDGQEVNDLKTNPKTYTTLDRIDTLITNVRDGQVLPSKSFLVKGSAPANMKIKVILKNDFGLEKVIAETVASENNVFVASVTTDILDGAYLLGARTLNKTRRMIEESPSVRVTLQTKETLASPEIKKIEDKNVKGEKEVALSVKRPTLVGISPCANCEVYVTWQSLVGTSVILTDVTGGEFSAVPPFDLAAGEHTVDVVAIRDTDGATSAPAKARMKITIAPAAAIKPARFKGYLPYAIGVLAALVVLYGAARLLRRKENE